MGRDWPVKRDTRSLGPWSPWSWAKERQADLLVWVVLAHHRRRVLHFNVMEHPTAPGTGQQMIEAFPEEAAPRYLRRDREKTYGREFRERIEV